MERHVKNTPRNSFYTFRQQVNMTKQYIITINTTIYKYFYQIKLLGHIF